MNEDRLRRAEELASRSYQIELQALESPGGQTYFFGRVPELPGCVSDGDTKHEAKANVRSAMIDFIYFLLEDGLTIPEPRNFDNFTAIDMTDILDEYEKNTAVAYRSLSFGQDYSIRGATASQNERRVYVA